MARPVSKETQLRRDLKFWQSHLRLKDWDIAAEYRNDTSVNGRDAAAYCSVDVCHRRVDIAIANGCDSYDKETSLVHELLHIHLGHWHVEEFSDKEIAKEQAINAIAEALVSLRRKNS